MFSTIKPFKEGRCKCCGKNGRIRSGLCIDGPVSCYKKDQVARYKAKLKRSVRRPAGLQEKPLSSLIKLAETLFNFYIRSRDRQGNTFTCISCGNKLPVSQLQAGHYLPAGSNAAVRFNEDNVHGQCRECNCDKHGNREAYRRGLIGKIGEDRVLALEQQAKVFYKYDRAELGEVISRYREISKAVKAVNQ